jgi:hypothetical protein
VIDDPPSEPAESDLRRRAAWLLAMLAVVAVLFATLMTVFLNTDGAKTPVAGGNGVVGSFTETPTSSASRPPATRSPAQHRTPTTTAAKPSRTAPHQTRSCPTSAPCILEGDVGNAISAVNTYRAQHQLSPVPGAVSAAAQTCALHRGNGCSGGWAETELSSPNGKAAVAKIQQFARLLDPQMTAINVGWAYDPGSRTYYFVTIRRD